MTFPRVLLVAASLALAYSVELSHARAQGQRPLTVSVMPSTLQPGDVAQLTVGGAGEHDRVTGTAFDQELVFHWDVQQRQWRTLAGIDLDVKPASYAIRIGRNAKESVAVRTVRVFPKQFPIRRLRVPGNFVDPPAEALEQIEADRAALAQAYARVTPRKWLGPFVVPVDGQPTSNFGTRSIYNGKPRAPHAGVDFVGAPGTPIRAANHGEVVVAAPMYFTGNTVVIDYGDRLFSVFAHLSELHARVGDTVEPRTIVGLVGATGRVTGPHLHWSVRLNGARVDPFSLIAATAYTIKNPHPQR